ncbi:Hypp785 [Branchiostoma lanceolatum]|uniref:Hypp785 protein n=1 Tax=Branchiostoma lanceolatum TaxID=7740 RepID=A0A8J9YPM4_BRALA|nr:Hypp785 [Branchiostoma lanceolatum]
MLLFASSVAIVVRQEAHARGSQTSFICTGRAASAFPLNFDACSGFFKSAGRCRFGLKVHKERGRLHAASQLNLRKEKEKAAAVGEAAVRACVRACVCVRPTYLSYVDTRRAGA